MIQHRFQGLLVVACAAIVASGCAGGRQLQESDVYIREQNWQKARTALEAATQKNPTDGNAFLQLAEVYAELGMIPQMSAALDKARSVSYRLDSKAEFIRKSWWIRNFRLGNGSFDAKLFGEAAHYYRLAVQIDSSNVSGLRRYGAALFKAGRYRDAESIYARLLQMAPGDLAVMNNLAHIYFIQKRYPACISLCDQILEKSDVDIDALRRRAYAYDALDNFAAAEKDYILASLLRPSARTLNDLGLLYFRHRAYKAAITRFTQALPLSESKVVLYRHLGEANWNIHNYPAMARWYQKVVQANADDLAAWQNLAVAYEALGQKELLAEARHYIHKISGAN